MTERHGVEPTEPTARGDELRDAERRLRGLAPDVQPTARWLLARVRPAGGESAPEPPLAGSVDAIAAAASAVREAILDATEGGLSERKARLLHGRLDQELASLLRRILRRERRAARALLRDVSHDLRSPLGSILFLADALAGERSGPLNEVQRRQLGVLYYAALSLEGLLNDLIDAVQLGESAALEPVDERFSVESVLEQVDRLSAPLAAQSGVELAFSLETLGPRSGDRHILSRVLLNLIANAIRATTGTAGRVEVRVREERADWLLVTVEDGGTEADLEALHERLREAPLFDATHRDRGWTHGLGLSICSRLVAAAGGRIDVESNGAGGCRFRVELPFPRGGRAGQARVP